MRVEKQAADRSRSIETAEEREKKNERINEEETATEKVTRVCPGPGCMKKIFKLE
jgi:hypothetical protein